MKSNELMLGDLIYNSYHKKNIKWDYSEMFCPNGKHVIGRDLEPIPLTEEILRLNGFEKSYTENKNAHYSRSGVGLTLNLALYTTTIIGKLVIIKHVHELQHALRLCHLHELADTFKIE